jgi:DNA-binding transcriptional regulator YiaG
MNWKESSYAPWYIRAVREALCLTIEELARKLNVSYVTLQRWETDKHQARGLSKRNLTKFLESKKVKALNITMPEGICVGGFLENANR